MTIEKARAILDDVLHGVDGVETSVAQVVRPIDSIKQAGTFRADPTTGEVERVEAGVEYFDFDDGMTVVGTVPASPAAAALADITDEE